MKKLRKLLIGLAGLSLSVGAAIGVGLNADKGASEAEATYAGTSGTIGVELQYNGEKSWRESGAKVAIQLRDGSGTSLGWTNLITTSTSVQNYVLSYSGLSETPSQMRFVRFSNEATDVSGQIWDEYTFYALHDCAWIKGRGDKNVSGGQYELSNTFVASNKTSWNMQADHLLKNIKINDENHFEIYGRVTLQAGEQFTIKCDQDAKESKNYSAHSLVSDNFSGGGDSVITCTPGGTFDFYYDFNGNDIWITREDIVEADGWATYFHANVGCDSKGISKPSGWGLVSSRYSSLSPDAKDFVYGATANASGDNLARALATYDWAVSHNPNLTESDRFVKDRDDNVRALPAGRVVPTVNVPSTNDSSNAALIAISTISAISLLAVGGYFFVRKRKEDR